MDRSGGNAIPASEPGDVRENAALAANQNATTAYPALQEDLNKAANASFSDDAESNENEPIPSATQDTPPKICSVPTLKILVPVILTPFFFGYCNGVFGVYITLYEYATNCKLYKAPKPCETLSGAKCQWAEMANVSSREDGFACGWRDKTTCYYKYADESSCKQDGDCAWNTSNKVCGNKVGYTSSKAGLLGAAMIIGFMISGFCSGYLTVKLGFRLSFFCIGIIACIACVLVHISTAIFNYWLLFVARLILGLPIGWQSYASVGYTNALAHPSYRETFGTIFQISMSFAAFVGPVVGVALGNSIYYTKNQNANLKGRMQGLMCIVTFLAACILFLPLITRNIDVIHRQPNEEGKAGENGTEEIDEETIYTKGQMAFRIFVCFVMAVTLQFTGISAVTNFAPKIMGSYGLDPLVGNVVLMAWNAVTVFFVLPLSRVIPLRTLFLSGSFANAFCCIFLCGVPVYPGIAREQVKNGVALTGILIYIALYQLFIGPCQFVLALDMFPRPFKPYGMSSISFFLGLFNLLTTLLYPIATENLSGGPSGDQNKGQAIVFMFFGVIGFITVAFEYFFMKPWIKPAKKEHKHHDHNNH